jgi:hypothetical protein
VQQQHAPLGAVALGGRLEGVDQLLQRAVDAENAVAVPGGVLGEELETDHLLLELVRLLDAVAEDHVVQPLVGGARHLRVAGDDVQVFLERTLPVDLLIFREVQLLAQGGEDGLANGRRHRCLLSAGSAAGAPL